MRSLWICLALVWGVALLGPVRSEENPARSLTAWIASCELGQPRIYRNLAIYPILRESSKLGDVSSLDEAITAGSLKVTEVDASGSVNSLLVENSGKLPVFVMAGEILAGAKQDRILQHDLWLPAGSGKVSVAAYCVEQGRWDYRGGASNFQSKSTIANLKVRGEGRVAANQSAVWRSVNETQVAAGFTAPTGTLNAAYEDKKVVATTEDLSGHFLDMPAQHERMCGAVVGIGDSILAVDAFSDRRLLAAIWPKLVKSYALEAYTRSRDGKTSDRLDQARRFLHSVAGAEPTRVSNPGSGVLLELKSAAVGGEALWMGSGVAHLEAFPTAGKAANPVVPIQRHYPR